MTTLSQRVQERVEREFTPGDRDAAKGVLLSYVAVSDEEGTERVRHAMLTGAGGDLRELRILAAAARKDYRDVLYWTGC